MSKTLTSNEILATIKPTSTYRQAMEPEKSEEVDQIQNLEDLLSRTGINYPHFFHTILPMTFILGIVMFLRAVLQNSQSLVKLSSELNPQPFYTKCISKNDDDRFSIAAAADDYFVGQAARDLAIVANFVIASLFITTRLRNTGLFLLFASSVLLFIAPHTKHHLFLTFLVQASHDIFLRLTLVLTCELVPKYHRLAVFAFCELALALARICSPFFLRLNFDMQLGVSNLTEACGFITIIAFYLAFFFYRDSFFNLLAHSKYDLLQEELDKTLKASNIRASAGVLVDQIAFETFETNDSILEVLGRMVKSTAVLREMFIVGILTGCIEAIDTHVSINMKHMIGVPAFDTMAIEASVHSFTALLILILSVVLPRHRMFPLLAIVPIMFLIALLHNFVQDIGSKFEYCSSEYKLEGIYSTIFMITSITLIVLARVILAYIRAHIVELTPALIRVPVASLIYCISYSFNTSINTENYKESGRNMLLVFVVLISMMLFLLRPRKEIEMIVFFSDIKATTKKKKSTPPPEVLEE